MITTTPHRRRLRRGLRRDRRGPAGHARTRLAHRIGSAAVVALLVGGFVAATVLCGESPAHAAEATIPLAAHSITRVVNNIRNWLVAILVAVATLFLTIGGLRYLAAGGDPGEVEKAKLALKSAAIGYALALLAPLFVTIIGKWVD